MITSPLPPIDIPDQHLTEFVLEHVHDHAEKPAFIDFVSGEVVTYSQLDDRIRRSAGGLRQLGFGAGDVLGLMAPNIADYAVAFHAAVLAGGAVTTINPSYNEAEIRGQLIHSAARFLVTTPESLDVAREASEGTTVEKILVVGQSSFADLRAADPLLGASAASHQLAALPFSSGTSGHPKGVMLTHGNLVANLCQAQALLPASRPDIVLGVLPFFHIYGMTIVMNLQLRAGATIVTMQRFDLTHFLTAIERHRVTHALIVPPIALALAKHPMVDDFDLSSLQLVVSGAAPLGPELEKACADRLGCTVCQGYGMTEASPCTHTPMLPGRPVKPGTIGFLVPNLECRIIDLATGDDAAPGERGEMLLRGPNVMKGYLDDEVSTRDTVDKDGWLHTGDVAVVDEDGYFAIVDRVKELIKYNGFQVAPAELEALLLSHPRVQDVAVIPVPDDAAGEIPKAYVVSDGTLTAEDVMAFVAEHVTSYKRVRVVEFVEIIPKSASGKVLRRVLRQESAAVD